MGLELKSRALLKLNLRLFMDMHFLREGGYTNVASGQLFYDNQDMSVLLPDTSADDTFYNVSDGQVWQSPFRQWVYESGVPLDGAVLPSSPPVVASGLYIEGAFRHNSDPEFGHTIDYINGRVIFNSPQSLDLKVHGEFSARDVRMGFEHDFNQQLNKGFLNSKFSTNPLTSMNLVYPSGFAQPFPAVFMEVSNRSFDSYELGNRSQIINDEVIFHVWAMDDLQIDNIVDIITSQVGKTLPIVDFNVAPLPLSGIYNTVSNEYIPYQSLLTNKEIATTVGTGRPVKYISYIDKVESMNVQATSEYERAMVVFKMKTYLNAPNQTLGTLFGPINRLGTVQDTGF